MVKDLDTVQLWEQEYGPHSKDRDPRDGDRRRYLGDDHVNPMFRPTVQRLYEKLWSMKVMHDQDNKVYLLQRLGAEMDPPHLAQLIHQLQGRLYYKLGYIDTATSREWPILHFADVRWPWQWGPEPGVSDVAEAVVSLVGGAPEDVEQDPMPAMRETDGD